MTGSAAPGRIGLLGSGETAAAGGRLFETLVRDLPRPVRIAVLETPAGFELNSPSVAGRVADFLRNRLGNYDPQVSVIPARRRDTPFSPDDPATCAPLLDADLVFAGPGSPTYAARQLRDSRAWQLTLARIAFGAQAVFASAAAIAVGRHALPVYEIYKAGEDLHWQPGLDLFGPFGASPVFMPHWNNTEGGADLDTGRCFMGRARFDVLRALLPPTHPSSDSTSTPRCSSIWGSARGAFWARAASPFSPAGRSSLSATANGSTCSGSAWRRGQAFFRRCRQTW